MKSLWFFAVLICVASCRLFPKDEVGSVEKDKDALDFDIFNEDPKFLSEEWRNLGIKDGDIRPDILFWNFNSLSDKDLESERVESDPFFKNINEVGEEKGDIDSPLFLTEDDESELFKEKSFYNFDDENNNESDEKYENDDWLYSDYADLLNKLNEIKNLDKEILPLPSFENDEENYDNLPEGKTNDDRLLNDYDFNSFFLDKQSEEKKDNDDSSNKNVNIDDIMLPFNQLINIKDDKLPKVKENDDWKQLPIEDDYDYFIGKLDKLNQEMKDLDPFNKNANIEVTLLTNVKNKITIRVVSIQDDMTDNSEIPDEKKGLVWETFPEGKYVDTYEYTDNSDFDDRVMAYRYFSRSSMFMVSTVLVVFSVMIFGFCLLCKIFGSKKKDSAYQPLNEEVA